VSNLHITMPIDPDGNDIELYVDDPDVDWEDDPAAVLSPIRPLSL
jgi:catechol 2,3-dioxygenase